MIQVFVRSRLRSVRLNVPVIVRLTRNILEAVDELSSEVSLTFVGDRQMRRLNRQFRQKARTTDVLAFAVRDVVRPPGFSPHSDPLGDVVISVPMAMRQARRDARTLDEEIAALLVHGLLHLCGYDHERSRAEARRMHRREGSLLKGFGKIPRLTSTIRKR